MREYFWSSFGSRSSGTGCSNRSSQSSTQDPLRYTILCSGHPDSSIARTSLQHDFYSLLDWRCYTIQHLIMLMRSMSALISRWSTFFLPACLCYGAYFSDAYVRGYAHFRDNSCIHGHSYFSDNVYVCGNAYFRDNARNRSEKLRMLCFIRVDRTEGRFCDWSW
jgi:hypothetical protein